MPREQPNHVDASTSPASTGNFLLLTMRQKGIERAEAQRKYLNLSSEGETKTERRQQRMKRQSRWRTLQIRSNGREYIRRKLARILKEFYINISNLLTAGAAAEPVHYSFHEDQNSHTQVRFSGKPSPS